MRANPPTRSAKNANNPNQQGRIKSATSMGRFKENIKTIAKHAMKNKEYKLDSHIKALRKDITNLNNDPQADTNNDVRANEAFLTKKLKSLENRRARNQKDKLCANIANHGETLGGIWSILNKEKKPRDYIHRLKIPNSNPPKYERNSRRMADLARKYHENLQTADLGPLNPDELEMSTEILLQEIPEGQKITNPETSPLNWKVKTDHTTRAL